MAQIQPQAVALPPIPPPNMHTSYSTSSILLIRDAADRAGPDVKLSCTTTLLHHKLCMLYQMVSQD